MEPATLVLAALGCALVLEGASAYAWGDLHISGDRFIFVAVADRVTGGMDWFPPDDRLERARVIHVPSGEDYFTRANVFVCRASLDLLNARAAAFLQPSEGLKE